jgi:hypothetical protein
VGKLEGMIQLDRPGRRWEDNMKVNGEGIDWIELAQDRDRWRVLVNAVMNIGVP